MNAVLLLACCGCDGFSFPFLRLRSLELLDGRVKLPVLLFSLVRAVHLQQYEVLLGHSLSMEKLNQNASRGSGTSSVASLKVWSCQTHWPTAWFRSFQVSNAHS
ncbi:unnamed protein product [Symbiodinium natans]|uniref:Uncharacterized protein n=1 Tax=Symbiodinium natans TaxID=878477 RepID=A0A812II73_9DINO|nr:unnamed protein product [Symbiodinium natans]